MDTIDCTDIKVLLSGLIDDEVDEQTRYRAERHLAECAACRHTMDEMESLNHLMALEAAEETPATGALSDDFIGAVLERTVHADAPRRHIGAWTNWFGWIAAAATVALAATVWVMDQQRLPVERPEFVEATSSGAAPRRATNAPLLVSQIFDGTVPDEISPAVPILARIERDDAETLDMASLLLEMLLDESAETEPNLALIREIAEYDEVLPRLEIARHRIDPDDRPAILATELILRQVLDHETITDLVLQDLRDSVAESSLSERLSAVSSRWDFTSPSL
ncbi:MAG: zf-HC2 domain-containing protein [Planctomycetes bacterium]|nr:zf-HC2 domain-containing protein [Planctomycetota bacterium]